MMSTRSLIAFYSNKKYLVIERLVVH